MAELPEPPPSEAPAPVVAPSVRRSVMIGIAIAVAVGAICFFLIAIPFYTLASFDANGMDRPIIRTGLFRIALPVGALIGAVSGASIARWLHRGNRWTIDQRDDRYSNR